MIRASTYSSAFLNQQVILLLDHLGVKPEVFTSMNEEAMQNLDVATKMNSLQRSALRLRTLAEDDQDLACLAAARLFFGPSRQFSAIFLRAMLLSGKYTQKVMINGESK